MNGYSLTDFDPTPRLFYSQRARVCHGYTFCQGPFVTDDFGNSVRVSNDSLTHYLRQSH
jgi:hypothetical protein